MENTLDNKAKFFAQYWGQKLLAVTVNENDFRQKIGNTYMGKYHVEMCHLDLKPLSSISENDLKEMPLDNDFEEISSIKAGEIIYSHKRQSLCIEISIKYISKGRNCGSIYYQELKQQQIDYLRLNGYALPWMGLTIEDLINYGWIKVFRNKILNNNNGNTIF